MCVCVCALSLSLCLCVCVCSVCVCCLSLCVPLSLPSLCTRISRTDLLNGFVLVVLDACWPSGFPGVQNVFATLWSLAIGTFPPTLHARDEFVSVVHTYLDASLAHLEAAPRKPKAAPKAWASHVHVVCACVALLRVVPTHSHLGGQRARALQCVRVLLAAVAANDRNTSARKAMAAAVTAPAMHGRALPTLLVAALGDAWALCVATMAQVDGAWFGRRAVLEQNEALLRGYGRNLSVIGAVRSFYARARAAVDRGTLDNSSADHGDGDGDGGGGVETIEEFLSTQRLLELEDVWVTLLRDTVSGQRGPALDIVCMFEQPEWLSVDEARDVIEEEAVQLSNTKLKKRQRQQQQQQQGGEEKHGDEEVDEQDDDDDADGGEQNEEEDDDSADSDGSDDNGDGNGESAGSESVSAGAAEKSESAQTGSDTKKRRRRKKKSKGDGVLVEDRDGSATKTGDVLQVSTTRLEGPCDILSLLRSCEALPLTLEEHRHVVGCCPWAGSRVL